MSVYPERRKGSKEFTGYWLAEVTRGGKKTRLRVRTYDDAVEAEASLKGTDIAIRAREVVTLGKLHAMAENKVWRGQKDELRSGRRWLKCLDLLGRNTPVDHVRLPQLEAFVDKLRSQGLDPKTINRYLACVSKMLRWAHKADLIQGMPHIPRLREGKGRLTYLPEHLTEPFLDEVTRLAGEAYGFAAEVLLLTGMRVNELLGLSPADIEGDIVHLTRTKTDSPRSLPLPEGYGGRLSEVMEGELLAYRKLLEAIGEASEAVCGHRLTCHSLRHTTATRLTTRGIPTLTVADYMGHRSLATTRLYTHHAVEDLRSAQATLTRGNVGVNPNTRSGKPLKTLEVYPGPDICSPLRSHSATRPNTSETSALPETAPAGKRETSG